MLGDASFDIWACGDGGGGWYIILLKTFVVQLREYFVQYHVAKSYMKFRPFANQISN